MESLFDACLQDSQLVTYTSVSFGSQNNRRKFRIFSCQSLGKFEATQNRRRGRFLRLTAVKVRLTRYS